jgi:hypothetical protein
MFQVAMTTKDLQTHTYKIGLNNYVVQNNTKEIINNILNEKARNIIKNNVKLQNKEILKVKITKIKKALPKK